MIRCCLMTEHSLSSLKEIVVKESDEALFKDLRMPRICQLGLVVNSIDKSMEFYNRFLGMKPWYRGNFSEMETVYDGQEIDIRIDIVFAYSGKLMIELIEVKGGDDNIYSKHLRENGEGLHHLGVEVSDYDFKLKQARQMGIEPIQSGKIKSKSGAITKFAYLDTVPHCGYPIELIETRKFGVAVGMSHMMIMLGCLLGETTRLKGQ